MDAAAGEGRGRARLGAAEGTALAAVVALAVGVRALSWDRLGAMKDDGVLFLGLAERMAAGDWSALGHDYHPLYPFTTLAARLALDLAGGASWEAVGAGVSIAGAAAAVVFLFLFLRDAFGPAPAWLGAALLAVHDRAVGYTADVQSEGLYLGCFVAALALAWWALRTRRASVAGWAGAAAGLAYLVRPEGLGVALVAAAVAGVQVLRGAWRPAPALGWGLALAGGAALFVLPYATVLRVETGLWQLTQKKSVSRTLSLGAVEGTVTTGPEDGAPAAVPAGWPIVSPPAPRQGSAGAGEDVGALAALGGLFARAKEVARAEVLALFALGLVACRGRPGLRGRLLGGVVLLYGVVLWGLLATAGYLGRRHVFPVEVALYGYVGLGGVFLAQALGRGLARVTPWHVAPGHALRAGLAVAVLAALLPSLDRQREPRRAEEGVTRSASEWLREAVPEPGPVAAPRHRDAFYAGASHVEVADLRPEHLLPRLRSTGARHLIVHGEALGPGGAERLAREPALRLLHRARGDGDTAFVFAVGPWEAVAESSAGRP